jgi:lipid-binding SYLF domain-containing protein
MEGIMPFMRTIASLALVVAGLAISGGCATAPSTRAERQSLQQNADATLGEMIARDPALRDVTRGALAYAVFPSVGKGGVLVGGAYGRGILYEAGAPTGYVSLEQASLGAQLGGQSFSELLVLRRASDVDALKAGRFTAGADLGVVVLSAGAAAHTTFDPNASVFVLSRGGLMVDVSINGQQLKYQSFNA